MARFFTLAALLGFLSACTAHSPLQPQSETLQGVDQVSPAKNADNAPQALALRYGRYTQVSTTPTSAQRDLLAQIIEVNIPSHLNPSLQEALQYVLQRSGYTLCPATASITVLLTRPLPAVHYRLGPMALRDALHVLGGPAWQLTANEVNRSVCFDPQQADHRAALITTLAHHPSQVHP